MLYEYSGYLKHILYSADTDAPPEVPAVTFTTSDIALWGTKDLPFQNEWNGLPVHRTRKDQAVRLVGRFQDVRRMDNIPPDIPSYWVPLSSLSWKDERFPVDVYRYPIFEITYRCTSENALPEVVWTYEGGLHKASLPSAPNWRTVARCIPFNGIPHKVDAVIIRLYSSTRSTESVEIRSIRFRETTREEQEAIDKELVRLNTAPQPRKYRILDEFMPLGVTMDAGAARRLAEMLGISLTEYWGLALEDVVRHHHNCIAIDNIAQLTEGEFDSLLSAAEQHGIKMVVNHDFPGTSDQEDWQEIVANNVQPHAESETILAWGMVKNPPESELRNLALARQLIERADEKHGLHVMTRYPNAIPLLGPHFPICGFSYPASHAPWGLGPMVRNHVNLLRGQQFWVEGPAFVFATGTPEWSTCPETRLMVNLSMANGARGWFSAAYHNDPLWSGGTCERSLTGPFLTFSDIWTELDNTLKGYMAVAPMLLHAKPTEPPADGLMTGKSSEHPCLPEGIPAIEIFRLQGNDFDLFVVVSNDARGISSLNYSIPQDRLRGREIYDITDFVRTRTWYPMPMDRHVEMFPGEARIVLLAEPHVCAFWRDSISWRLIEDDRRQLAFNTRLARAYNVDTGEVERLVDEVGPLGDFTKLGLMDRALYMMVDLIYNSPEISEARSAIVGASAAVCACDGALCRFVGRGKTEQAQEWGMRVIPLAREFTNLRLELRQGNGGAIVDQCKDLHARTTRLLEEIRALSKPAASYGESGTAFPAI